MTDRRGPRGLRCAAAGRKRSGRGAGRGSATVLAVLLVGVLATAAVAGVAAGGILVGHRRAASAADLAALAAAQRLVGSALAAEPGDDACAVADRVSQENDARLRSCGIQPTPLGSGARPEVVVEVEVDVDGPLGARWTVRARARAGETGPTADAGPGYARVRDSSG